MFAKQYRRRDVDSADLNNINVAPAPSELFDAIKANYDLILDLGMRMDALTSRMEAVEARVDSIQFGRLPALESAWDRFTPTPEGEAACQRCKELEEALEEEHANFENYVSREDL
jgi:hypothetical protein